MVYSLNVFPVFLVVAWLDFCLFRGGEETFRTGFHGVELRFCFGVCAGLVGFGRVGDEEGVLHVAGGVLLRDEEGVEVPEAGVDEAGDRSVTLAW